MNFTRLLPLAAAYSLFAQPAQAAPGDLDPLNANIVRSGTFGSNVLATAVQPDGKIIIGGWFTSVLGVPRANIARLNADGTLDIGFDPSANDTVYHVAVLADGKVLLGGGFTAFQPNGAASATTRLSVARVNGDGTLDEGFDPKADRAIFSMAVQPDGKVLLAGIFTTLQPNGAASTTTRNHIARINTDGTLDMAFDPNANQSVVSVALQSDGKIVLGGYFTTLQPNNAPAISTRQYIARVNGDGTLDADFNPNADSTVFVATVQADGKVLLGGYFTTLQPNGAATATTRRSVARVNADGTLDTVFNPQANGLVRAMAIQADGKVLLGGDFTTLQPNGAVGVTVRSRIARVNSDGTLDMTFDPKPNNGVNSIALQADGKVLPGGSFTTLQPNGAAAAITRKAFARLLNDPAIQTLTVPDGTQALWTRGGTAPELTAVTFEQSTDGGANWTPLGAGTRIGTTANWQRTGLSLVGSGHLRARGRTAYGDNNGSSGLVEQVVAFSIYTPLQQWKLTHLGDANAPNLGDPDHDGLLTLAEYGLNLSPETPSQPPGASVFNYAEGSRLRMFVPRDPAHNDITVSVEATGDLVLGPWTALATSTLGAPFTGPGYVGGDDATPGVKTVEVRDIVNLSATTQRWLRVKVTH